MVANAPPSSSAKFNNVIAVIMIAVGVVGVVTGVITFVRDARQPPASGAGGGLWVARRVHMHDGGDRALVAGGGFGRRERSGSSLLVVACATT
eukprot:3933378-Prymnesium_polylepis.2